VAAVVARLLGPRGCPWDREQTHQSLRRELLEETHEVLEALDAGDMDALSEELGDLLLQVLMHSEMARQAGEFDLGAVYEQIATKLIRRHPHIFGDLSVAGSDEVLRNWEAIKQQERAAKGQEPRGLLDGIPAGLPALMAAQEVARKLAKAGFEGAGDAWREVEERAAKVRAAATQPGAPEAERALGELLLAVTGLARRLQIDAESALRGATARLRGRFAAVGARLRAEGRTPEALSADEKLDLWRQAQHDD
jgi:tetrapyrrole methylase family protein/MazG family protein